MKNLIHLRPIVALVLVIVLASCFLCGCGKEEEQPYSAELDIYSNVYADISSIEPLHKLGVEKDNYTILYCACTTSDGQKVYLHITMEDYWKEFDASATFEGNTWNAQRIAFSSPVRVHGEVWTIGTLSPYLQGLLNNQHVIVYTGRD